MNTPTDPDRPARDPLADPIPTVHPLGGEVVRPASDSYASEAAECDESLDRRLDSIRHRTASGALSPREAADERVEALEAHIEATRQLRIRHFGSDNPL